MTPTNNGDKSAKRHISEMTDEEAVTLVGIAMYHPQIEGFDPKECASGDGDFNNDGSFWLEASFRCWEGNLHCSSKYVFKLVGDDEKEELVHNQQGCIDYLLKQGFSLELPAPAATETSGEGWKVMTYSTELADTGDYLNTVILTNGKIKLYLDDDGEHESDDVQEIADLLNKQQRTAPDAAETKGPFRVGRKQRRVVLDASGLEVVAFPVGSEHLAQEYCNFKNTQNWIKNDPSTL